MKRQTKVVWAVLGVCLIWLTINSTKINNYYEWALGKENWHIIKQCLAFMLNEGGEKIQWFIILHSQVQGIGKGLLGLIMQSLFGSRNVGSMLSLNNLSQHTQLL